ncbi:MAG: helix-turn-helix transcriptional regulator [Alphaproteobacteria bacterium]|nr:helix-turn-helix transcriptional regulator [Alphaproteobacteria bacterium]
MDSKFLNFIDNAIEQFSLLDDQESMWHLANRLVTEVGGNALNITTSTPNKTITWARSSMNEDWLNDYLAEGFYTSDPLYQSINVTNAFTTLRAGSLTKKDTDDTKLLDLNHGLVGTGYNSVFGLNFAGNAHNTHKLISICSDLSVEEFQKALPFNEMRLLASIISVNIGIPGDKNQEGVFSVGQKTITSKEGEVFSWLAAGLRNEAIADKLNIAEITVRKHIISARKKLNAHTREQALAVAICDGHIQL